MSRCLLLLPALLLAAVASAQLPATPKDDVLRVYDATLYQAYKANVAKADLMYTGKTIEVTGQVTRIVRLPKAQRSPDKEYLLELNEQQFNFSHVCIQVFFRGTDREMLAKVESGNFVTILAACEGTDTNHLDPNTPKKLKEVVVLTEAKIVPISTLYARYQKEKDAARRESMLLQLAMMRDPRAALVLGDRLEEKESAETRNKTASFFYSY